LLNVSSRKSIERLTFLTHVGVEYLTLDRTSSTLSGGEGQRMRLATQIGSSLVGVLYILDEPTIGLDPAQIIEIDRIACVTHFRLCCLGFSPRFFKG
jgi:excinuclease UvrABC ATPase subunit